MADKREPEDGKPCLCYSCQAKQRHSKDDKRATCKADADCNDQACKQQLSKQDERKEQRHQHAETKARSPGHESKDSNKHEKPIEPGPNDTAPGASSKGGAPGVKSPGPSAGSNPALGHEHTPRKPLGDRQPSEAEKRAEPIVERGKQVEPPKDQASPESAKTPLQSKPESKAPTEQLAGSSGPKDEGARGATDSKAQGGAKRPSESTDIENDGKPSKQPKQDEQPKEEQQPGQRQLNQQQQPLNGQASSANPAEPPRCTECCPIHCTQENRRSASDDNQHEPPASASERETHQRNDTRNRGQRRPSSRGRGQRSSADTRVRARRPRRRSSGQRNTRRRR